MKNTKHFLFCPTYILTGSIILLISLTGCKTDGRSTTHFVIHQESLEKIQQMAKEKESYLCLILSDPTCDACTLLESKLNRLCEGIQTNVLFNRIDVSLKSNKWYQQWLFVSALPTMCVFNQESNLVAVLSGSSEPVLNSLKDVLEGNQQSPATVNMPAYVDKMRGNSDVLQWMHDVFRCKQAFSAGEDISETINTTLTRQPYPFNLYLKMMNEKTLGHEEHARTLAYQLLAYSYELSDIAIYGDLFRECKIIIDPDYNIAEEPILEIMNRTPLFLSGCELNQPYPFTVTLRNDGKKRLDVYDIVTPCSCLDYSGESGFSLLPAEERILTFVFTPNAMGLIKRQIIIASNGIEGITTIEISATL